MNIKIPTIKYNKKTKQFTAETVFDHNEFLGYFYRDYETWRDLKQKKK